MSSPELWGLWNHSGRFQSLGLEPEKMILIRIWLALGEGISESIIETRGPGWTMASFMVDG